MNGYLPKNEIVFFNPGKTGILFVHKANTVITARTLLNKQEQLVQMTNEPVIYIEDRRIKKRERLGHTD